jgi:hypothetical protein
MLTFTPDGTRLVVANEAEPNSYNQAASVDPLGTVSIIDVTLGTGTVAIGSTRTVDFTQFNGQEPALRAAGIRLFGPNATAAQDFEPEYIAVSPDSTRAYVTLQENNAIATILLATGRSKAFAPSARRITTPRATAWIRAIATTRPAPAPHSASAMCRSKACISPMRSPLSRAAARLICSSRMRAMRAITPASTKRRGSAP